MFMFNAAAFFVVRIIFDSRRYAAKTFSVLVCLEATQLNEGKQLNLYHIIISYNLSYIGAPHSLSISIIPKRARVRMLIILRPHFIFSRPLNPAEAADYEHQRADKLFAS